MRTVSVAVFLLALSAETGFAVSPDECEIQRAAYPKDWNDVSRDRSLFTCSSHYSGSLRVMLGAADKAGRRLMTLLPLQGSLPDATQDPKKDVYRIWLDRKQSSRLIEGKYFATIVRQKSSCWIRGALSLDGEGDKDEKTEGKSDSVFFMDNVKVTADGIRPETGSFYNKAPRFSVFQGDAYECTAASTLR
jgi:hypothetical protein